MGTVIESIAIYLPKNILTNEMLSEASGISLDNIYKNTGIKKRYISSQDEIPSDMAYKAALNLFSKHKEIINEIDLLIFCSEGFDYKAPATSCILQHRLGLNEKTACIDLPYGCSGYIYGLGMANAYLNSNMANCVLFLTADMPSAGIKNDDFELKSIFSDIGTATLIKKSNKKQNFIFGTDGSGYNNLIVDHSGSRNPQTIEKLKINNMPYGHMRMNSTEIFLFAVKKVPILIKDILEKENLSIDEIDLFVFHQASLFMLEAIRKKSKIPKNKFFVNIENFGNSVSSTIPIALFDAEQKGALKKGMRVLLAGFGIGYSWGATILEY